MVAVVARREVAPLVEGGGLEGGGLAGDTGNAAVAVGGGAAVSLEDGPDNANTRRGGGGEGDAAGGEGDVGAVHTPTLATAA